MSTTHQPTKPDRKEDPRLALDGHFESTFLHAAVGVAHVDKTGRFLRINPKFLATRGVAQTYAHSD
jgi:hypothetical protein